MGTFLHSVTWQWRKIICFGSGTVELTCFPAEDGSSPTTEKILQVPSMYAREGTGPVVSMEWSSDGYVLAVGCEKGWAIWSIGGRCLAWGFGIEYEVDPDKSVVCT